MSIDRLDLNPVGPVGPAANEDVREKQDVRGGEEFQRALDGLLKENVAPEDIPGVGESDLTFSRHAVARLKSRGISLSTQDLSDLSEAVDKLSDKNVRESLLLMGEHAFIVGIPKRTVITAMTRQEAVGSIFTNIDSTLVVR